MASANVIVKWDPTNLAALLRSGDGPVAKDLFRRAEKVKVRAQELVGVGGLTPLAMTARPRKSGTLRDSIRKQIAKSDNGEIACFVGSDDPIALWHHEGTVAHQIPTNPRPGRVLVFYWPNGFRGAGVYYFRKVQHPGTKPNRFLLNALPAANE